MTVATYSVSILGRSSGRSAVGQSAYGSGKTLRVSSTLAAASYRSGEKLRDQQLEKTFNYSSREDVKHTEIISPEHAPEWAKDREKLWNTVEAHEKRKDAQLARSIIVGLPRELTLEQNIQLVREHVQEQFVNNGMIADIAIHDKPASDGKPQPHAHILLSLREVGQEGFGNKNRAWNHPSLVETWRNAWEEKQNAFLETAGSDARVNMKSYERQAIDKTPGIHNGYKAEVLEQQGVETRTGDKNRAAKQWNRVCDAVKGWFQRREKAEKTQEATPQYSTEDINAYYAKMEAEQARIDEPDYERLDPEPKPAKQEEPAPKEEASKPRRVTSPDERAHYQYMQPFLQSHAWESTQDRMQFVAVTAKHMQQKEAEARRDVFDRLAGQRDTHRFRAIWQDRPLPNAGRERSRGRER